MEATSPNMQMHAKAFNARSLRPWIVCFTAALFFFYEFIQMNMFNAISGLLMRDFAINSTQLGLLSSTYLLADMAFLLPAGMILDRFSIRTVVLSALTLCLVGTVGFAVSTSIWFAGFFHFISGVGNAFCFLSCILLAGRWFPPKKLGLVIGLVVTMAMLGGVVAQTPFAYLTAEFGWRTTVLLDAGLGFLILIAILGNAD